MRGNIALITVGLALATLTPAVGQTPAKSPYTVQFDPANDVRFHGGDGEQGAFFTVNFKLIRHAGAGNEPGKDYKVLVELDGVKVAELPVPEPKLSEDLSAVLAIDISGSMGKVVQGGKGGKRIAQARSAARSFINRLPKKADCGLILFDHEIKPEDRIAPEKNRKPLLEIVDKMEERGGTAYLDAAKDGIDMLARLKSGPARKKAVVIMTDGVDLNSKATLDEVIKFAL